MIRKFKTHPCWLDGISWNHESQCVCKEECEGMEEGGPRTEFWRTQIFKRWLKAEGMQMRPRARREWHARRHRKKTSSKEEIVSGNSSDIVKPEKVSSDFSKQEFIVGLCQVVSMVRRLLEPEEVEWEMYEKWRVSISLLEVWWWNWGAKRLYNH